jgi:hypothetical protein
MGGWEMNPGKRTYALLTLEVNEWGQVEAQAKFIEGSASGMGALGLRPAQGTELDEAASEVMTPDQTKKLLKDLEQIGGADVLSTPRITTLSGRQAQISVLQPIEVGTETYPTGPNVDLVPTMLAEGFAWRLGSLAGFPNRRLVQLFMDRR